MAKFHAAAFYIVGMTFMSGAVAHADCNADALAVNAAMLYAKGIRQTDQQAYSDGDIRTTIFDWVSPSEVRYTVVNHGGFTVQVEVMQLQSWVTFNNGQSKPMSSTISREIRDGKKLEYPFALHPERDKILCGSGQMASAEASELFSWTEKEKSFTNEFQLWADPTTHFIQGRHWVHKSVAQVDDSIGDSIFARVEGLVIRPPK